MHVTVIAKSPVPGRVKTRLCPPCSPIEAAELAAAALADTCEAIDDTLRGTGLIESVRRVLLLDGVCPTWIPRGYDVVPQCAGDLGDRLADGFARLGPGIIVGMETPHAIPSIPDGLAAISRGDAVLGPALDGGYWSIGLSRVDSRIFTGIEMSTDHTGSDQLRRMRMLGHEITLLPSARDIDDFADVRALAASGGGGRAVSLAIRLVARHDRTDVSAWLEAAS